MSIFNFADVIFYASYFYCSSSSMIKCPKILQQQSFVYYKESFQYERFVSDFTKLIFELCMISQFHIKLISFFRLTWTTWKMDSSQTFGKYFIWNSRLGCYSGIFITVFASNFISTNFGSFYFWVLLNRKTKSERVQFNYFNIAVKINLNSMLLFFQPLRTKNFTKFMKFASLLGTEEFYALLLCVLTW